MRRAAILCLVLTCTTPKLAWGGDSKPSHREAAAELFKLTGSDMPEATVAIVCLQFALQQKMEWEADRETIAKWVEDISWERMEPRMIDVYVAAFTEEEIRDQIAFYKTPTGQKTVQQMPMLIQGTLKVGLELAQEHQAELLELLETRRKEIEKTTGKEEASKPETLIERANRLYDATRWAEARDAYLQHLKSHPKDTAARADLGVCYRQMGEHKKALGEFDRVLSSDPDHGPALYNKILVLAFDLERKPEALALLPRLQKLMPGDAAVKELADALLEE